MNPHSFQKRKLKPLKMDSPDKFKGFIHKLWDKLYWANFYCDILIEASKLCRKHEKAANFSPVFWTYTLQAHYQTASLRGTGGFNLVLNLVLQ
jgi:hypothetical protein